MQDMSRLGIVLLCGAILLFCCAGAPGRPLTVGRGDYTRTQQDIAGVIEQAMHKDGVTGLSIALVDDQQVVWAQGFGYADEMNNIPATPETVYRVGSISELFTATAAMQLAEQGKIDIDRPLQTYLPEFSVKRRFTDPSPITLRHLMSHHAGLLLIFSKACSPQPRRPLPPLSTSSGTNTQLSHRMLCGLSPILA